MAIEERKHNGNSRSVVATECPFCEKPIKPQQGLATHLESECQAL